MANTISLSTIVNTDDTATISDGTTFTSPTRSGCAVFVKVYKVSNLSVQTSLAVTSNDDDPETDSSWSFDLAQDGYYQAYYSAIPNYTASTYAIYDAVYSNGVVYRSKQSGNVTTDLTNTTWWEVISDPASLAANEGGVIESANIDSSVYNDIIFNKVNELDGDKAIAAAAECNGCGGKCSSCSEADEEYDFVHGQRAAAEIAEIRQQFIAAEIYIRRLDEFLD
jgi:hypothetical protein